MNQRGRKSVAELSVISVDGSPDRLQPPGHLSADERQRFADIVATCDPRHFRPSDTTLLCRFVEADVLAQRAAKELRKHPVIKGRPSPWLTVQEKNVRALTALAIRLRLSPQSRIDAKVMGRHEPPMRVNPWEWDPPEEKKAVKHAAGRRTQAEIFRADGAL
jgi:phage terminase small subunit